MGEWIKHTGDGCPVAAGTVVFVRLRNGREIGPIPALSCNSENMKPLPPTYPRNAWIWDTCQDRPDSHVVEYRLFDNAAQAEAARRSARIANFKRIADTPLVGDDLDRRAPQRKKERV